MPEIRKAILSSCKSGLNHKPVLLVPRRIIIAYWLIPAEPAHSFFQGVINDLACRYNAPVFEPHVTVHVGSNRADAAETAVSEAARSCKLIKLKAVEIGHSSEFIKTLFVQFALNADLRQLSEIIGNAAQGSAHYELRPHLSLLYKGMLWAERRELASSINVPFPEVNFDVLRAVRCISPTRTRADVEAWHVVTTKKLCG
jgi:cyclic phosphodiesterase-like protein